VARAPLSPIVSLFQLSTTLSFYQIEGESCVRAAALQNLKEIILSPTAKRSQALDVLRFVAVFLVIGRHLPPLGENCSPWLYKICALWTRGGWIGVDLFFVLSGFLVSGLLFNDYKKNGSLSIARFYIRRGFKIYPAFYFFLFSTLIVWLIFNPSGVTKLNFFAEVVFLQNYIGGIWWHTWSLAVEEHFYFLLPVVLLILLKRNKSSDDPFRPIVTIAVAVCVLFLFVRILQSNIWQQFSSIHLFPSHIRLDSLIVGVAISYFYNFHRERFENLIKGRKLILLVVGLLLLSPAFIFELEQTPFIYTFGFAFLYLSSAALLCAAMFSSFLNSTAFRPVGYIGSHSYSIYLWHAPVMEWGVLIICKKILGTYLNCTTAVLLTVILGFATGIVMANVIEFPFLKIRDKFFPSKSQLPVDVVAS
jgi:peptidoglycan/LPS O-acetylase OafA/YrhL